jgi:hypothetical protein
MGDAESMPFAKAIRLITGATSAKRAEKPFKKIVHLVHAPQYIREQMPAWRKNGIPRHIITDLQWRHHREVEARIQKAPSAKRNRRSERHE